MDSGIVALLERGSALDDLGGWLGEARAGHGQLVFVGGEAGGKTSLMREFALRHRRDLLAVDGRWLSCACDSLTTPRPLGPVAEVASQVGGLVEALFQAHQTLDRRSAGPADRGRAGACPGRRGSALGR